MRISSKGRYALASVVSMAQQYHNRDYITIISISEELGISKIYLEQVFSLLKKSGIVRSAKGSQGGYQLALPPNGIKVLDVMLAVEISLFEPTQNTVLEKAPELEKALRFSTFGPLEENINQTLSGISIADIVLETENQKRQNAIMFYI